MAELKPCPFCGGDAEMYTGRTYIKGKSTCETYEQALEKLEEFKNIGVVLNHSVGQLRRRTKTQKEKWGVRVEMQAFIPRCCNTNCLGRTAMMFMTETEATEAWNTRKEN